MGTDLLTLAHVGDSRAILVGKDNTLELTEDHKPNLPKERARIENSDPPGRVVFDGYFNHRVFSYAGMYPGLNMSRAIGDVAGHKDEKVREALGIPMPPIRKDRLQRMDDGLR